MLARLDGYLTGRSKSPAKKVALQFVKQNHAALGLTTGDLETFNLKREYVDIAGVHHLYWVQRIGGRTVFGNGLTAAVTKDGKLLTVGGSPVSKAHLLAPASPRSPRPRRPSTTPGRVSAPPTTSPAAPTGPSRSSSSPRAARTSPGPPP